MTELLKEILNRLKDIAEKLQTQGNISPELEQAVRRVYKRARSIDEKVVDLPQSVPPT